MTKRLKASDVYKVANYTRNQLRGLLSELGYKFEAETEIQARIARTYSPHDFLIILIACELESWGIKRNAIAVLLPLIAKELTGPRLVANQPKLLLNLKPISVQYVDADVTVNSGLVLPLSEIFSRVDFHLHQTGSAVLAPQTKLNFGPSLIEKAVQTKVSLPSPIRKSL